MTRAALAILCELLDKGYATITPQGIKWTPPVEPDPAGHALITKAMRCYALKALVESINRKHHSVTADPRGGVSVPEAERVPAEAAYEVARREIA